jgi:curved DNA-binding protein CbpA
MEVEGWGEVAAVKGDQEATALVREASDQISNFCRVSDFPFHLGENRFALVLPEAGDEGAGVLCQRLRAAVEAMPERVTLVWGLAVAGVHGEGKDELLVHADGELIAAHHDARERITAEQRREAQIMGQVSAALSYYQQLGVERSATQEEIKAAFRTLARHYHPDQTKMENRELAERRFQEITRAYRVLSDPKKRAEYDGPTGADMAEAQLTPGIDYYRALRVPRVATPAQILEAYRALAYEHRTAHRQGRTRAEERFKVVTEAYRVLADPDMRIRYDRVLPPEVKDRAHGFRRDTPEGVLRDVRKAREKLENRKGEPSRDEVERLARLAEAARRVIPDEPLIGRSLAALEAALGGKPLDRAGLTAVAKDLQTGFTG